MLRIAGPDVDAITTRIVSVTEFKSYIKITGTGDDSIIDFVLDAVHRNIHRMLGERFLSQTATLFDYLLDGPGGSILKLPQWPITTVTSVEYGWVDGNSPDTDWRSIYTYQLADYYFNARSGRLFGVRRGFTHGFNNIRVKWNAGYSTASPTQLPQDLVEATLQWAAVMFSRAKEQRWDRLSIGRDAETTAYTQEALPSEARRVILNYAPVGVGLG